MSKTLSKLGEAITSSSKEQSGIVLPGIFMGGDEGETDPYTSLGVLALNIAVDAANLTQAIRTVYCVGQLITNPLMLLDTVGLMASGASAIMIDMAERMVKLVKNQLTQALSQIKGTFTTFGKNILEYIDGLKAFLESIETLGKAIINFIDNTTAESKIEYEEFCSKEDCEFMFAMMAACLLSKLLGNKLQEFEQKVSTKINNTGAKLNDALAESLSEVNNISGFIEREKFMMEKASKQIDGMHRLIEDKASGHQIGSVTVKSSTKEKTPEERKKEEDEKKKKELEEKKKKEEAKNKETK